MAGLDEDMEAPMAAFIAKLNEAKSTVFEPLQHLDPDSVAAFSPLRQATLSLTCAFTAAISYKLYRMLNNIPIDEQTELKFKRVQEYLRKVREISEIESVRAEFGTTSHVEGRLRVEDDSAKRKIKAAKKEGPKINKVAAHRIIEHHTGKRGDAERHTESNS